MQTGPRLTRPLFPLISLVSLIACKTNFLELLYTLFGGRTQKLHSAGHQPAQKLQQYTQQVSALLAGIEVRDEIPGEEDPDAGFDGAPFVEGGDDDEWEAWCEKYLEPLNEAE